MIWSWSPIRRRPCRAMSPRRTVPRLRATSASRRRANAGTHRRARVARDAVRGSRPVNMVAASTTRNVSRARPSIGRVACSIIPSRARIGSERRNSGESGERSECHPSAASAAAAARYSSRVSGAVTRTTGRSQNSIRHDDDTRRAEARRTAASPTVRPPTSCRAAVRITEPDPVHGPAPIAPSAGPITRASTARSSRSGAVCSRLSRFEYSVAAWTTATSARSNAAVSDCRSGASTSPASTQMTRSNSESASAALTRRIDDGAGPSRSVDTTW